MVVCGAISRLLQDTRLPVAPNGAESLTMCALKKMHLLLGLVLGNHVWQHF